MIYQLSLIYCSPKDVGLPVLGSIKAFKGLTFCKLVKVPGNHLEHHELVMSVKPKLTKCEITEDPGSGIQPGVGRLVESFNLRSIGLIASNKVLKILIDEKLL